MKNLKLSWFVLFFITSITLSSQSPYTLDWKKEAKYIAVGGATVGLSIYFRNQMAVFTPDDLELLDKSDINGFDRKATGNYSKNARNASDIFWASSHVLPFLFIANSTTKSDFGKIAALYGEVFLINGGLTTLSKYTAQRARPFVYNDAVAIDKKLSLNAKTAFFSGHTSFTAANTFFAAKVFADYFPNSKFKPLVWGIAATIPAATGYFRVAGGKHFPSDVIIGYTVGAAIGILIPQWHKKKDRKLSMYGGFNGVALNWKM